MKCSALVPDGAGGCMTCGRRIRDYAGKVEHMRGRIAGVSPFRRGQAAFCESTRGEWGGICPDCGRRLPSRPGPLRSWMSTRPLREGVAWDGSPIESAGLSAARRARQARIAAA